MGHGHARQDVGPGPLGAPVVVHVVLGLEDLHAVLLVLLLAPDLLGRGLLVVVGRLLLELVLAL